VAAICTLTWTDGDATMGASDSRLSLRQAVFRLYEDKARRHGACLSTQTASG
jgi:hypothetical protein